MRTNIMLDDALMKEAQTLSGIKTKRGVVQKALEEYVRVLKKRDLREIRGKVRSPKATITSREVPVILVDTSVLIDYLKGRCGNSVEIRDTIPISNYFGRQAFEIRKLVLCPELIKGA